MFSKYPMLFMVTVLFLTTGWTISQLGFVVTFTTLFLGIAAILAGTLIGHLTTGWNCRSVYRKVTVITD